MAKTIIPCGGWYVDGVTLTFDENKVLSVNSQSEGQYLPLSGGVMEADANIQGTDSIEISVGDTSESSVVGITQNGVTIEHNTNSDADSSIRAITDAIELEAGNTTITINGTGVAFGGASLSGINSLTGEGSGEIAVETILDMNNHKITNVANPTLGGDAMNKTTADNTYATKAEISNFITNDDLPVLATSSVAGIVKQGVAVPDSSGATDTTLESTVNALLLSLRNAGIIANS